MRGWECNSSVVDSLTRDRGKAGSSLTGVTALCPWAIHINPSLVLVQLRMPRPYITERLLMGRKESNQTKKISNNKYIMGKHVVLSKGSGETVQTCRLA